MVDGERVLDAFGTLVVPVVACACVVDQHVDLTESAHDGVSGASDVALRREVGAKKLRAPARIASATRSGHALTERLGSTDQAEVEAERCQRQRSRATDPGRRPSDDADASRHTRSTREVMKLKKPRKSATNRTSATTRDGDCSLQHGERCEPVHHWCRLLN